MIRASDMYTSRVALRLTMSRLTFSAIAFAATGGVAKKRARALQALLFGVESHKHGVVRPRRTTAMTCQLQQHGNARRIVVGAVIDRAISHAQMIVVRRDHHRGVGLGAGPRQVPTMFTPSPAVVSVCPDPVAARVNLNG